MTDSNTAAPRHPERPPAKRRTLAALAAAAIAVALAASGVAAATSGSSSQGATAPEPIKVTAESGPTLDRAFIYGMVPHHQAAIDMATVELRKGRNRTVRQLARSIIRSQGREITEMTRIASSRYGFQPPRELTGPMGELMGVPLSMDMSMMGQMLASMHNTDRSFLTMMIPHHSAAIGMANEDEMDGSNSTLKKMSMAIISSQAREIGEMERLLTRGL